MDTEHDGTAALAAALRRAVADSGRSLREVEDAIGMGRDYLSQLLRGNVDLKVKQVYAVLGAIGLAPAAFFGTLHPAPAARPLVQGLSEDELDRAVVDSLERLASARAARGESR